MTKLILSIIVIVIASSCMAPPVKFGDLKIHEGGVAFHPEEKVPFTGRAAQYNYKQRMTSVYSFVNGKMAGPYTRWWGNGEKREEGTLKDGKNWGDLTLWHENGNKKRQAYLGPYRLLDQFRLWHISGQKMVEWNRNDLECRFWSQQGQLLRHDKFDISIDEKTNKIDFSYKIMGTDIELLKPEDVTDVFVSLNEANFRYDITLKVTPKARQRIRRLTAGYIGHTIAIYEDNEFMNPSRIKGPIDTEVFLFAVNLLAKDAEPVLRGLKKSTQK